VEEFQISKIKCHYSEQVYQFNRGVEKVAKKQKEDEYLLKQQSKRENRSQPVIHKDLIKKIKQDNVKFKQTMPDEKPREAVPIDHTTSDDPTPFDLELFKCHN